MATLDIILLCVYVLALPLSYRNLEEMMCFAGLSVDYTTVIAGYAPELDKLCRAH